MNTFIMIIIGYLLGSIPFGVIYAKMFGLGDIRKKGSRSTGATNVMRHGGLSVALLTVISDMLKAIFAVLLGFYVGGPVVGMLAGAAAVVGHNFPVWLGFRGGKGFASTLGVLMAINPILFVISGLIWIIMVVAFGYSSLAGIVILCLLPVFGLFMGFYGFVVMLLLALLGLWQHRENIQRLADGKESKIEWKWKK